MNNMLIITINRWTTYSLCLCAINVDGIRFEVFLNGTNRKAGEAIKRAEEETRKKQEKSNEIKRLTQNTETLVTDLTKLR